MPKKELPFNDEFKKLILDMDFGYFLNEDLNKAEGSERVSGQDRQLITQAYNKTTAAIKQRYRKNRKQCRLWLEGIVRLQWHGGMLPAQFRLDGFTRELNYYDLQDVGENWAYFEFWQKLERRRRFWRLSWDRITKTGAVLAIALTLIKIWEAFFKDAV